MIFEYLCVCCDRCLEEEPSDVRGEDHRFARVAFRASEDMPTPSLFRSHLEAMRVITAAGWHDNTFRTLCPKHYEEFLDSVNPVTDNDPG